MGVNSAFLYGKIEEEFMYSTLGFGRSRSSLTKFKVERPLYGLHSRLVELSQFWEEIDSWQCKMQNYSCQSPSEADYVVALVVWTGVIGLKNQSLDYGFNFMNIQDFSFGNERPIYIVKNTVFLSKNKHIDIWKSLLRDFPHEKKLIQMIKIHTDHNVAYLLTKAFDVGRFQYLIAAANDEIQVSTISLPYYWILRDSRFSQWESDKVVSRSKIAIGGSMLRLGLRGKALEEILKQTKQVYGAAYTKLIMKVKKLEKIIKTSHSRRRSKIVVSDDEEDSEDSSKQGRMIEEIDQDAGVTLLKQMFTLILEEEGQLRELKYSKTREIVHLMQQWRRQEELDEEERQRMARVHEVGQYFTEEEWENIRARVEVDEELSRRLQVEERNTSTVEVDSAKMLVDSY
ncbi:hypothetical protein Tco_0792291 [Tanacetum coccineum]